MAYIGLILAHVGSILAHVVPSWPHLGSILASSWPTLAPSWPTLAPTWHNIGHLASRGFGSPNDANIATTRPHVSLDAPKIPNLHLIPAFFWASKCSSPRPQMTPLLFQLQPFKGQILEGISFREASDAQLRPTSSQHGPHSVLMLRKA